ncbi:MAG: low molecular weight phosphatase family protein [Caulobacterales bacterium 32-69-10]|nr:MAG: low molecular weight phosphatase family protein [Caulobacterales bacterium 32-69-10]
MANDAKPSAVLFACNLNRVRSPMAAALLRRRFGDAIVAESCGLRPAEEIDPFVVAVMDELGLDLEHHRPKGFDEVAEIPFDLVVSLTPEAQHRAVEMSRDRAVEIEYWPTFDPTLSEGSREQRLEAYRLVRDDLDRRLAERFGRPSTFGG